MLDQTDIDDWCLILATIPLWLPVAVVVLSYRLCKWIVLAAWRKARAITA